MDWAMGWVERHSAWAASSSSISWETPSARRQPDTENRPSVRVPVLSKATIWASDRVSRWLPPLTRTPSREARPMPAKKLRGTEITRAQGQEMTRKHRAL